MVFARSIRLVTGSIAFAVAALAPNVSWAVDAFLKISDCDGPETRKGFEKQIPLAGFNSRVRNTATTGGGGAGAGRPEIQPIEVLHDLDVCSPQFFLDTVTGKHVQEATITFVRPDKRGMEVSYFQIKLSDVLITGVESMTVNKGETTVQDAGAVEVSQAPDGIQEVVTLSFSKIQLTDLISKKTVTFDLGKSTGS